MKMKILRKILLLVFVVFVVSSCEEDPFDGIVSNDRQFLSFKVPGQVGLATIKSIGDDEGVIEVSAVLSNINLSGIIPDFDISEGALVRPAKGHPIDFNNAEISTIYQVVSESGKTRNWTINIKRYESTIEGQWNVEKILYDWQVGLYQDWGWGVFGVYDNLIGYAPENYMPEVFSRDFTNIVSEEDNTIEFVTVTINENGNAEGTFSYGAGLDGEFSSFILDPDHTGASRDYSIRFKKIPQGNGVWEYNEGSKVLTLWDTDKGGVKTEGVISVDVKGVIRIAYDTWIDEYTWDHMGAESHIQNAHSMYYHFDK